MLSIDPTFKSTASISPTYKRIKNYLYNMQEVLGRGSFSTVYKAIQESTNEPLAIKVVQLSSLTFKKLEELLQQEINIISSLKHPNIIRCIEVLKSANNCYFVTELCEGGNLQKTLKERGRMEQEEIWGMVRQIYEGLKYLSSKKIIHRDIKPANIFIKEGTIKIADFGFAIHSNQSFNDFSIGSPLYMSPQGYLRNCYGSKTDVWAFGVVLYELLHGRQPLSSCKSDDDLKSSIVKNIQDDQFRQYLSPQIKDFIKRCLEVDENKRITFEQMEKTPYFQRYTRLRCITDINSIQKRASMKFMKENIQDKSLKSINVTHRNNCYNPNQKENLTYKLNIISNPLNVLKPKTKKQIISSYQLQQNKSFNLDEPSKGILLGGLTFNQSIGLIHYCRIGYKLCQQPIKQNFIALIKSLILKILQEIQIKANIGLIRYEQQSNKTKKQSKLKLILHQYQAKYQKQLRGNKSQVNLQEFQTKLAKQFQQIEQNMDKALQQCYLTMILNIFTNKLIQSIASKSFTIFGEIGYIDICLDEKSMPKCLNDYSISKLKYSSMQK